MLVRGNNYSLIAENPEPGIFLLPFLPKYRTLKVAD